MLKIKYKHIFFLVIMVIVFYSLSIVGYQILLQKAEKRYYQDFLRGNAFYTPVKNGLPWEINVVYNEVNNFAERNNLVLLGSSTTREGVMPENLKLKEGWKLMNMSISADSSDSFQLMLNYLNKYANHKLNKTDVVIVHIWYANFIDRKLKDDYLKKILEMFGLFSVNNGLEINGPMSYLQKEWKLINYKIRLAFSKALLGIWPSEIEFDLPTLGKASSRLSGLFNNGAKVKVVSKKEKLQEYCDYWTTYMQTTQIPGRTTDIFKQMLIRLKSQTNIVVVNLYVPSWHKTYQKEKMYEMWLNHDLRPFLKDKGIIYLDFADTIPDSEYGDSAHLFIKGRERYTELFSERIAGILDQQ